MEECVDEPEKRRAADFRAVPRLTRVEVELVVASLGPASGEVTMTLMCWRLYRPCRSANVATFFSFFPRAVHGVSPGRAYSIGLRSGGGVFGWKYVVGGYAKGATSLNGKPLSRHIRSTFLSRTFGAN
jgi:hypothetical protein